MKRYSAAALTLALLAGGAAAACAQSAPWQDYTYPADGFALSSPRPPALSRQNADGAGGTVELHFYSIEIGDGVGFMVIASALHPSDQRPVDQILTDAKSGGARAIDGQIVRDRPVTLGKVPGVEIEVVAKDFHARARYYLVGRMLYQVMSLAPTARPILADTDRFYKSFHLLKPAP
jgi:hypothetical protein